MTAPALDHWIGKTEVRHDHVTVPMAERMAATLDRDDPPPRLGDKLPIGWHSMLFPRIACRSMVGRDGHPKLGDFLPPMPLPRRMFAGRRTQFIADLLLGDAVTCTSVIASITPKTGTSGSLIFLTLRHSIESARGLAIVEEQDVVYRDETVGSSAAAPLAAKPTDTPRTARWMREHMADEVTALSLFGPYLQRPPHPLRPALCHRSRGLSGVGREWRAHHALSLRASPRPRAPRVEDNEHAQPSPAVRQSAVHRVRRAHR